MPYSKAEQREYFQHVTKLRRQAAAQGKADVRRDIALNGLRARMRAAVEKCLANRTPISRASLRDAGFSGNSETMSLLVAELIADGTVRKEHLHPNRTARLDWQMPAPRRVCEADEVRVELPPLRTHAPEVPPEHAKVERPIWDWMAERYWTEDRRAMYRNRGAT